MTVPTRGGVQADLASRLGSGAEARWMVDEVLGRRIPATAPVSEDAQAALEAMAARRLAGEPLQYVLGSWSFRTLELAVDARALIPRPETEQVVEAALAEIRRVATTAGACTATPGASGSPGPTGPPDAVGPLVADLGTGTGAIALSIAAELGAELPGLRVWASDADPDALALASHNLAQVARDHPAVAGRVVLARGSWFDALTPELRGRLSVVVANPPYVSEAEWGELDPPVRREPRRALVAGASRDGTPGLADVEAVLAGAPAWLVRGGAVVVELAPHQAKAAAGLALALGYADVAVVADLAGRDRAVVARA